METQITRKYQCSKTTTSHKGADLYCLIYTKSSLNKQKNKCRIKTAQLYRLETSTEIRNINGQKCRDKLVSFGVGGHRKCAYYLLQS